MRTETKLMSRSEAAAYLGIPPRTLYALVRQGAIPAVRVGRVLRFDALHLDEWLRQQTANAPEPEPELLAAPTVDLRDIADRPLESRLLAALLVEQRRGNVLLTRLLNRR